MRKLAIDIGELEGAIAQEIAAVAKPHPLDEVMSRALESERGIKLEFNTKGGATRARHRIYRRRQTLQAAHIHSFDSITVLLEGTSLIVRREEEFRIIEL